ncbi:MAG: LPS export ABC transporter periplasmic protein LptC [Cryomorphaceae bacterium]|nr:LPS export ABC transporter periplasmic protein LptC [Flavobacteriales bacterium]
MRFTPVAIIVAGVFFSCQSNELKEVLEYSAQEELPARSTANVLYTYTDSGMVNNTLRAAKVDQFSTEDSTYSVITGGFELKFFTSSGELDGKLTAINAYLYDQNSLMVARDSVVFVNRDNEVLKTEELIWVQDSAIVYTDKFVTIERDAGVIYGKGLRANENFTNYDITQPQGDFYIEDEQ